MGSVALPSALPEWSRHNPIQVGGPYRRTQTRGARMVYMASCKCEWNGPPRASWKMALEDAKRHERNPWNRVAPGHYTDGLWHICKMYDGSWGIDTEVPGDFRRRYQSLKDAKQTVDDGWVEP